ncbi:MAG: hypothetical protein IJ030_04915 [Oscillospiraceae bacterium]|nr:hypothetical protein [Oscillospiraceae bacterium]
MTYTEVLILCVLAAMVLPIILVMTGIYLSGFIQELRYLNTEIARTGGEQCRLWLRRRRRLWLSLIPFVRY